MLDILEYLKNFPSFGLNGLQKTVFSSFSKMFFFFSSLSREFPDKGCRKIQNMRYLSNLRKFFVFAIFMIHIVIGVINGTKHCRIGIKQIAKNTQIMPFLCLNQIFFLEGSGLECEKENISNGWSYSQMNINISHCFFLRTLTLSSYGGVIYVNGGFYSMNVNYSMFYNCSSSLNGGAICFDSINSNLRMICGNRCSCGASKNGNFALLIASQTNQVEYISISFCSYNMDGSYPICFESGNQRVDNTNSSMNNGYKYSGIGIFTPSSFTSILCTFSNNKVSYICIYFSSITDTITLSYANILHNNSPSGNGVIYADGEGLKKMIYCIFQNNSNFLFCIRQGSLEVSHSFIDHSSSSFYTSITVSTANNLSFTKGITYQMQFFSSYHCNTDIPARTLDQSPMRSFEETLIIDLWRTNDVTMARTYDSECDIFILSSVRIGRKSDITIYPIFISLIIV